ncbi:hypothetical protein [Novosphingobium beihaiensis]|uniref:Uncharacterized protein n=1 Tax=Novosphingobium beihaiensis TaxID=2930389 RepID=A0ABT0BSX3_9SPHN|nr:hypothetical protein [Novosphingobium beihaiensis]MCJ2187891.1 hypothetical protein [Novosphingobium beihaiensis]
MTEADRDVLAGEFERTGVQPHVVGREITIQTGHTLTAARIRGLLKGTKSQIREDLWHAVLQWLGKKPDANKPYHVEPPPHKAHGLRLGYIPITDEMRCELNRELARTKVELKRWVRTFPSRYSKISAQRISNWKTGRSRSANGKEWQFVVDTLLLGYPTDKIDTPASRRLPRHACPHIQK